MSLAVVFAVIAVVLVLVLVLVAVIRGIVAGIGILNLSVRNSGRIRTVTVTAATEYKNPNERQNHKEDDAAHTASKKGL